MTYAAVPALQRTWLWLHLSFSVRILKIQFTISLHIALERKLGHFQVKALMHSYQVAEAQSDLYLCYDVN